MPVLLKAPMHLARAGKYFDHASLEVCESCDLVIVGAGISKLSAAWLYRKHAGADKKILWPENHRDYQATGIDVLSAGDARDCALSGFDGPGFDPLGKETQAELEEPYIYHFPDGNASLARLLVRKLIPDVAPGQTMDDVILARFDDSMLDRERHKTRLRLNFICVHAENNAQGTVDVTYIHNNKTLRKVRAAKVVMAGYNMIIPSLVPALPEAQKQLVHENVKALPVYTKIVIRNWRAFAKFGVHSFYCPMAPFDVVNLNYPVSIGSYSHSCDPGQLIGLHMIYVPKLSGNSVDANKQYRVGRAQLLEKAFAGCETDIRQTLHAMLADAGFDHHKDILAITVNRWPHGYAAASSVFSDDAEWPKVWWPPPAGRAAMFISPIPIQTGRPMPILLWMRQNGLLMKFLSVRQEA